MKANLPVREPELVREWEEQRIFARLVEQNAARKGAKRFVLHDGPPYANNAIHLGHALNKVLKDIVVKYRGMLGEVADFVPGWDCHGLPIELMVDKELGSKKREMDRPAIIAACRKYAQKWIDAQREQFKRLGVFGRWENPYATMAPDYEAATIRALAGAVEKGFLYRGKKPVYWCVNDRTALAEAEVEYDDHTSPSIYVAMDLITPLPAPELKGKKARLVIWTTTPWTLPANLAVCVHPELTYVAYQRGGEVLVVAKDLLTRFLADCAPEELVVRAVPEPHSPQAHGKEGGLTVANLADANRVLGYLEGAKLEGLRYRHPFMPRECPVILGEHVTTDAGTGLVHTAPGHGQEDFEVGQRYKLEVLNPVDGAGKFTDAAGRYAGRSIWEANPAIVADLAASGHLLSDPKASLRHSYPHCWRCHKPVVFRATDQWFLSMEHQDLRRRSLEEIDRVNWIPRWGRERIRGMIENRPDWCVSRQRTWGVPIPVFYCEGCNEPLLSVPVMERVASAFEKEGIEAWYRQPVESLTGGARCGGCGKTAFRREQDILDVWWDSGVSWSAVISKRERVPLPVDLYLEGSDQHRGWFHSALLTGVAVQGAAPYRAVLTHGFVVDGQGRKMSKSQGNAISPDEVLKKYGAEVLRLWVAAEDYRDDVRLSQEILGGLAEGYRKIRNTLRYALGNLFDFDPARHAVPLEKMEPLDRWAMARLAAWQEKVGTGYGEYAFHQVYHATIDFTAVELSSLYFDILKDRLYTARADGPARRSAQTALWRISDALMRQLAPILSFTASEAWRHLPGRSAESVFFAGFPAPERPKDAAELEERYGKLFEVREAVQKALEVARRDKLIGSGLEAAVTVRAEGDQLARLETARAELPFLFIVSKVVLERGPFQVAVAAAPGQKCARCWVYAEDVGKDSKHPEVCGKCSGALA
jgi:isoleucyl-tRNA synthetase